MQALAALRDFSAPDVEEPYVAVRLGRLGSPRAGVRARRYIASHEALTSEELTPFLAGLLELQPWLDQWHNEFDAAFGASPSAFFQGDRQMVQGEHGLTDDDLRAWRPVAVKRGAKKK
ncbi:hypothetical protein NKH18_38735 [Streptomyces sp. M10(2022)]